jgi:threonine/homoserine/homoserine lactone efflux protein
MANPRRRAIAAAGSVVCAAVVGVLASELAGRWTWGLVAALVAAVLLWAGIEAWRAVREKDAGGLAQGGIGVRQRARRVAGRLTGMRGPVAGKRLE